MTDEQIGRWLEVCGKATPGEWYIHPEMDEVYCNGFFIANARLTDSKNLQEKADNAAYIATFSPATVRRILEAYLILRKGIDSLLRKVNAVTSQHRHGLECPEARLTDLSNRQIEVEQALAAADAKLKGNT